MDLSQIGDRKLEDVDALWASLYATVCKAFQSSREPDLNQPVVPEDVEGRDFVSAPAICVPGWGFVVITTMMDTYLLTITYHHELP